MTLYHMMVIYNKNIYFFHCQTRENITPQASLSDFIATEHFYFRVVSISAAWNVSML